MSRCPSAWEKPGAWGSRAGQGRREAGVPSPPPGPPARGRRLSVLEPGRAVQRPELGVGEKTETEVQTASSWWPGPCLPSGWAASSPRPSWTMGSFARASARDQSQQRVTKREAGTWGSCAAPHTPPRRGQDAPHPGRAPPPGVGAPRPGRAPPQYPGEGEGAGLRPRTPPHRGRRPPRPSEGEGEGRRPPRPPRAPPPRQPAASATPAMAPALGRPRPPGDAARVT